MTKHQKNLIARKLRGDKLGKREAKRLRDSGVRVASIREGLTVVIKEKKDEK